MRILSQQQLRLAGAMAVLAAGLMLSPLSAMAGDQGGSRDKQPDSSAYTNYSSTPDGVATPCNTCYMGAGRRSADAALRYLHQGKLRLRRLHWQ
jgi:hypothetical protein